MSKAGTRGDRMLMGRVLAAVELLGLDGCLARWREHLGRPRNWEALKVKRYRKKPVEVEAVQFDGTPESGAAIVSWAQGHGVEEVEFHPFLADYYKGDPKPYVAHPDPYMRIKTLEGVMTASRGDYIIRGVKGEFYPCKPDIFDATYEEV